ncbi:MAG: cytochrome C oxidase subunit IV family protein [Verrucomicrobiales bacterium]|nr:cytochrome C oxidase subunit IV family protein [Verrucomicrobiales bacterium]
MGRNRIMRANLYVLVLLVGLTVGLFAVGGDATPGALAAACVLPVAGAKAILVGWQFMELRRAHVAWRLGSLLVFGLVFGALVVLGTSK